MGSDKAHNDPTTIGSDTWVSMECLQIPTSMARRCLQPENGNDISEFGT
jgi:hypothetical protein